MVGGTKNISIFAGFVGWTIRNGKYIGQINSYSAGL
jgi:hypothetical protein